MLDASEMIVASLSKIWHLVPIVIAIVVFKKVIDMKDKKRRIKKNEENEKNGLTLEVRTVKKYKDIGYTIDEDKKDEGIDLVCTKENKIFLFKCNNISEKKSVIDEDIKAFHTNAMKYVKTNNIDVKNVEYRYAIAYNDVLHKSASKILKDDFYNCKYVVL